MAPPTITRGSSNSIGMDLMRRISEGQMQKAPPEQIERIRKRITENCEELIEVGARIRPLMVGDQQVGWVRGLHQQERRMLKRWVRNPSDFVLNTLSLATTLTKEEIEGMNAVECRSLIEVVQRMTEYDLSLYPYMSAYVSTNSSETLWYGRGERLTNYEEKMVMLPDGKQIRIMTPPDHARVWASLCSYREQAKRRLEENFNALFVVRPWAGKSADPIANELRGIQRGLETDSLEPWERVVKVQDTVDKNDGWGHPGDSLEDLQRELKGMIEGDKHEQLMTAWSKQMIAEAEAKRKELEAIRRIKGTDKPGIVSERIQVLTQKQVKERQEALKKGKAPSTKPGAEKRRDYERDATDTQIAKITKYL